MAGSHRRAGNRPGNLLTPEADSNAVQREALAWRLRCQGYDFEEIAAHCGYANKSGAYKAYKRALSRIPRREIEEMRETIFGQQQLALKHMAAKIARGDTFAVREMTMIHDRMAKLFGLDTPTADAGQFAAQVVVRAYPAEWVNALPAMTAPVPLAPEVSE